MKQQIFNSKYATFYQWNEYEIFEIEWLATSEFAIDEDFSSIINHLLEQRSLRFVISNAEQLFLYVDIDFQINILVHSTKILMEIGCEKVAIIPPCDYISNLNIKQIIQVIEEVFSDKLFKINYLSNIQEAVNWLMHD